MKKTRLLFALLLIVCLLPVAAAATEDVQPPVTILLNGETMALPSGVQPWINPDSGRTYVPFRDVFEALGASVAYDADTRMVTAVRGDITIEFSQDNAYFAAVTIGGESEMVSMDPPITREGRILVPVRFAAQALGATVGWDSAARTVIIADIPTLVQQRLGSYEIMGKLAGLIDIDTTQNHQVDMKLNMLVDSELVAGYGAQGSTPIQGELSAIIGPQGFEGTGSLTADASAMLTQIPGMSGTATLTYEVQLIWNQETGMLYLRCPALAQYMGLDYMGLENLEAWMRLDLSELLADMDLSGLVSDSTATLFDKDADWSRLAATLMTQAAGDFYYLDSVDSYAAMLEAMDQVNRLLEDSFYALEDGVWTNRYSVEVDDLEMQLTVGVAVDADGAATAYSVSLEMGDGSDIMTLEMTITPNAFKLAMAMAGENEIQIDLDTTWAVTQKKPRTAPPKDEEVIDPYALMEEYYQDILEQYKDLIPIPEEPAPKEV